MSPDTPSAWERTWPDANEAIELVIWNKNPELSGWWNQMPDIRICSETGIKKARVETALRFWERQGYNFGEIVLDDQRRRIGPCTPQPFEILFRLPTQEDLSNGLQSNYLACTLASRNSTTLEVIYAEIFFMSTADATSPRMMEHEIGHALGWMHTTITYHLMYPEYNKTGSNMRGIGYEDYVIRRDEVRRTVRE